MGKLAQAILALQFMALLIFVGLVMELNARVGQLCIKNGGTYEVVGGCTFQDALAPRRRPSPASGTPRSKL